MTAEDDPPLVNDPDSLRILLMQALQDMKPLLEATAGYREKCSAEGFSETAAEQMAVEFHRLLLNQMSAQPDKTK